jgi:uncharacterized membrane protein YjjB (DUF3815 family)
MPNQSLTNEQEKTRNILYGILSFTIFLSLVVDHYTLVNTKHRYLINIAILGICGIVFYIGFKKQLINKKSLIFTIFLAAIFSAITLLNR